VPRAASPAAFFFAAKAKQDAGVFACALLCGTCWEMFDLNDFASVPAL
jgi:hypothetical protein